MYDFVFFLIYSQQKQKNRSDTFSIYNGSLIVSLAVFVHICLIFAIYRKIFLPAGEGYGIGNKTGNKFITILVMIAIFLYYNKRAAIVLNKYDGNLLPVSTLNVLKLVLIVFVPLAMVAILSVKPH